MAKGTGEGRDVAGAIAAGKSRNDNLEIDWGNGVDGGELDAAIPGTRSRWVTRLLQLRTGVEEGKGEYGLFYKIGIFSNQQGARNVIRVFQKNPEKAPGVFELKTNPVVQSDGSKTSELYASVVAPESAAA